MVLFDPSAHIDHVIDGVYISGWLAANFQDELRAAGITRILKLYEDTPYFPRTFNTLENAIGDGELIPQEALWGGVDFILDNIYVGRSVLVMCGAGISRSSTFVLAYLLERGYDLHDAFILLRRAHPEANPHPKLWESLITHYQLKYRPPDIWQWFAEV